MAPRHATRDAILTYMRPEVGVIRLYALKKYMWTMHHVSHAATRQALYVLVKAGLVERVGVGQYQGTSAGAIALEQYRPD